MSIAEANFAEECLRAHNEYRRRHGVPDLVLSKQICAFSEGWARNIASRGVMEHSQGSGYGENIYGVWNPSAGFKVTGREAVVSWYDEIKDHTFGGETQGMGTGHFTQVVWKNSKELGVGFAKSTRNGYIYVVANYSPQGNFIGNFAANVPPVGGFPDQRKPTPSVVKQPEAQVEQVDSSDSSDAGESSGSDDASDSSDYSGCANVFEREGLKVHNDYRKRHGVPSMKINPELTRYAQEWANNLSSRNSLQHRQNGKFGENLYAKWGSCSNFTCSAKDACDSWYAEIKDFHFGYEPTTLKAGHFTAMIWKNTTELGMAMAKSNNRVVIVANYNPWGNYTGQYTANCPRPLEFVSEKKPKKKAVKKPKAKVVEVDSSESSDANDASDASDDSDASDYSGCANDFEREGLKAHNDYRRRHGVPIMKINPELTRYAQEWANNLSSRNSLQHRQNGKFGENLYAKWGSCSNFTCSAKDACDSWYAEIKDFHFGYEPTTLKAGHFTAMIWKNTTELGMAMAKSNNRVVIVANYNPWGNYTGQYTANCPRPLEFVSEKKTKKSAVKKPKAKVEQVESSESSDASEASDAGDASDASEASDSSDSSDSSDCGNDFEKEGLKVHNDYRRRHGVPLMKINPELTRYAQEWANNLASSNSLYHRTNGKYGENLFCMASSSSDFTCSAQNACDSWYAEIKDFHFGYEPTSLKAGHFTAMIWKNTTELGMAMVRSNNRVVIVANYNPWGNYTGQYTANCPRPLEFASEEKTKKKPVKKSKAKAVEDQPSCSSDYGTAFEKEGLKSHNDYRRRHGVPLMKLNPELTRYAQEWADHLASTNSFHHRTNGKYGENLYAMPGGNHNVSVTAKDACDMWYAEIKDFHFGYEPTTLIAGHFTAMIWKNTTELGMAMAKAYDNRVVIVANYNPWGNYTGQYSANCPRPIN